jgi:hypothetical protein
LLFFLVFFYVVMYALFVLSVHVYYVNCNAKTQMGYGRDGVIPRPSTKCMTPARTPM